MYNLLSFHQFVEQLARDSGNVLHGLLERRFVDARRLAIAADFAHELQRSGVDFFGSRGSIGLAKLLNAAAHATTLLSRFVEQDYIVKSVYHAAQPDQVTQ
jgi:hypothetical protein